MDLQKYLPCTVEVLGNLAKEISNYDCLCLLSTYDCPEVSDDLKNCAKFDAAFEKEISCLWSKSLNVRIIYSPLGKLSDHDDVRKYAQAAGKAIARAKKAGSDRPVIALPRNSQFQHAQLITLLGALEELYLPIQYREEVAKLDQISCLGVFNPAGKSAILDLARQIEISRYVARDVGGGDPERMAPPRVVQYVQEFLKKTSTKISCNVISDPVLLVKEYPLFSAVNRAASSVERHRGAVPGTTSDTTSTESTEKVMNFRARKKKGEGAKHKSAEKFRGKKNEQFDKGHQAEFTRYCVEGAAVMIGQDRLESRVIPDVGVTLSFGMIPKLAMMIASVLHGPCKVWNPNTPDAPTDEQVLDLVFSAQVDAKLRLATAGTGYQSNNAELDARAKRIKTQLPDALFPFSFYLEQIGKIELNGQKIYPRYTDVFRDANERNTAGVQPENSFLLSADNALVQGIPIYVVVRDIANAIARNIVALDAAGAITLHPEFRTRPQDFDFPGVISVQFLPANRHHLSWSALVDAYNDLRGRINRRINNAFVPIDFSQCRGTTAQLVRSQSSSQGGYDAWASRSVDDDALQVGAIFNLSVGDFQVERDMAVVTSSVNDAGALSTLVNLLTQRLR